MAAHNEINRLKPILDDLSMEIKYVDKLNSRLLIRDIPLNKDKSQRIENLIRQNLNGVDKSIITI